MIEADSARRQLVDIRRFDQRMIVATQRNVQIIDRDQQNIRSRGSSWSRSGCSKQINGSQLKDGCKNKAEILLHVASIAEILLHVASIAERGSKEIRFRWTEGSACSAVIY